MAVTSGFFEAQFDTNNIPDREYSAEQFGSLFDGIISDGVFKNYGNALEVNGNNIVVETDDEGTRFKLYVKTGRAWLNHTWTLNNSDYAIYLDPPSPAHNRYDRIVLRVNKTERINRLVVIKGANDTGVPTKPSGLWTETVHDYTLADIYVEANTAVVTSSLTVTDRRGTSAENGSDHPIPFADVIVPNSTNIDELMSNLDTQFLSKLDDWKATFDEWFKDIQNSLGTLSSSQVVTLTLLVTKVYENEYISGTYPYLDLMDPDVDGVFGGDLYLSANDTGDPPSVEINYGYVSMKLSGAATSNEFVIRSEEIIEGS